MLDDGGCVVCNRYTVGWSRGQCDSKVLQIVRTPICVQRQSRSCSESLLVKTALEERSRDRPTPCGWRDLRSTSCAGQDACCRPLNSSAMRALQGCRSGPPAPTPCDGGRQGYTSYISLDVNDEVDLIECIGFE